MQDRLPPLRALRVLEAVQQAGSVTKAAELLNVSHSAVSHQIRHFEDWSGVILMHRHGRSASLTEAGESLASVVHEAFDAVRHEMDRLTLRAKAPVTIAALPIVAAHWLVPRIPLFLAGNPDISVLLSHAYSDRPSIPEPEISIHFGWRDRLPADALPFLPGDAAPVCAPSYLARHAVETDADIAQGTLIHDEDMRMWNAWLDRAGLPAGETSRTGRLFLEGSALLRDATLTGQGIAICRIALIAEDLRFGRLIRLSPITIDNDTLYYIRLSPRRERSDAIERVLEWLMSSIQTA